MPNRTKEQEAMITVLREKYNTCEERLKGCIWMSEHDKGLVVKGLSWPREHINTGRNKPSIKMIHDKAMFGLGCDELTLDDMLDMLVRTVPPDSFYVKALAAQIISLVSWDGFEVDEAEPIHGNYNLSDGHPDKTDNFNIPYYIMTDESGIPLPDSDKSTLSYLHGAVIARSKYSFMGYPRDTDGELLPRYPRPEPTDTSKKRQKEQFERYTKANATDHTVIQEAQIQSLEEWYEKTYMPHVLKDFKQTLDNQKHNLKASLKAGQCNAAEAAINVKALYEAKENQLKLILSSSALLRPMQAMKNKWDTIQAQNKASDDIHKR